MKIVSPYALPLALLIPLAPQACAQPLELSGCDPATAASQDCDVIFANPGDFASDASAGAQGNVGGSGNVSQGGAGGTNPAQGGSPSLGGSSNPGNGGTGQGGTASGTGGTAITTAGTAGSAGSAGTAGTGGTDTGGTGGTGNEPVFDVASCDFVNRAGCDTCEGRCPPNMGTYCVDTCTDILECVDTNETCITEADPFCGAQVQNMANVCTDIVNMGGGVTAVEPAPAAIARDIVICLCSTPRSQP